MELGIYSFGDRHADPRTGEQVPVADKLAQTLDRIKLADELGLSFYGLGEHHLDQYAISSPGTVLAAAASITRQITLSSAVTVLSTEDPVRLYQQFSTLDQLSRGRAELLAGRGSFTESFPLYGADLAEYDELFEQKLALLLRIDREDPITWSGKYRPPLENARILPRPYRGHLRISIGTGGNPESSIRAGLLGLPVVYAVIGGSPERFAPLVELYRQAGESGGHAKQDLHVTMGAIGFIARDSQDAKDTFYPYWLETMKYGARARGWTVPTRAHYDEWTRDAQAIFAGSPREVADRIISVARLTGADRYAMQMDWSGVPHDKVMTAIELLGTEVLPQVRKELGD
ncbi:LLM class flavin-dependent oxidoreductase [Amycolatopsis acidiphila]|uniref:LLM class flavin-dependent oxidoreductase n=1 Tax=Amycolatopsis acidiphila TaxID=715473 RepID=A0A558ACS7_9PSEU|nr:LLM class flavin-dependent oxidoreductase [Amycolatopsis acidiphila]TVT22076.1 LLM class flavin-dependent oxidoreductase [Amycolatopsis acidiphila]UIJ63900.1 LLM class flavin-dependent oxidoreductase [Amycolatopsis acidiphila]GHG67654.1 oxidoreductase [Amycolatopsis acidiphila]